VVAQSRESLTARNPAVPRLAIVPGRTDNAAKALGLGLATASCDYVLPLPRDAMLAPDALYRLAKALVENPGARVIYGDEDKISRRGAAASHGSSRAGTPICSRRRIIFGRLPRSAAGGAGRARQPRAGRGGAGRHVAGHHARS
jgi:cellulose synthase/poly-beta-1,6-N-acetylglucosamine synthase-like glycosyltransferase